MGSLGGGPGTLFGKLFAASTEVFKTLMPPTPHPQALPIVFPQGGESDSLSREVAMIIDVVVYIVLKYLSSIKNPSDPKARFIVMGVFVFEGLDGTGKGSVIAQVASLFGARVIKRPPNPFAH